MRSELANIIRQKRPGLGYAESKISIISEIFDRLP